MESKGKRQEKQTTKKEKAAPKDQKDTAQLLGIEAPKMTQFSDWYTQVILRADLLDYYNVSGCYILRPYAYSLWERIQGFLDGEIKKRGVKNAYFPIFVSQSTLNREEEKLEGFGAEVAWVTKCGQSDLAEPIAIRPTSETVMYPAFKKWIRSHRDLPLKINQWCNIVRWEFKHAVPFIRTREFLWQEGHTAYASLDDAVAEVYDILDVYARAYEELLAVPVVRGKKSKHEAFAGALFTTTIEAFVAANGRSVQAATSHCLGTTFAEMFDIEYLDDNKVKTRPYQNSWGFTTRSLGVCVMVHGDDKGLVLPPRVAPTQVVVLPLHFKGKDIATIDAKAHELGKLLTDAGIRAEVDDDDNHNPGWKFNNYEVRGVPLRVELGPKDMDSQQVVVVRRDNGEKQTVKWEEMATVIPNVLESVQSSLFQKAKEVRDERTKKVETWKDFITQLNGKNVILVPWCNETECELSVKERSAVESKLMAEEGEAEMSLTGAAKCLCLPLDQPSLSAGQQCFACNKTAQTWALFGRSY